MGRLDRTRADVVRDFVNRLAKRFIAAYSRFHTRRACAQPTTAVLTISAGIGAALGYWARVTKR